MAWRVSWSKSPRTRVSYPASRSRRLRHRRRQRHRRVDRRAPLRPARPGRVRRHPARRVRGARRDDRGARASRAVFHPVRPPRHRRRSARRSPGAGAARADSRAGQQRRPRRAARDRARDARVLGRPLRGEPASPVLRRAGGGARDGAAGGGSIINFGSTSWLVGQGGMPAYLSAKAAVAGLTRALARDLGPGTSASTPSCPAGS